MGRPGRFGHPILHALLIAMLGLLAYANTFQVPFVFDDVPNIVENPIIKDLSYYANTSSAKPLQGYAEYPALIRRFVGSLSFALNYRFNGLDVAGYHAVNLSVHIGSALLVYALVSLILGSPQMRGGLLEGRGRWAALLAAALFVSHPVQTQAVTYIVQRFASLAAMLYLLTVVLYLASRMATRVAFRWTYYGLGLLSAVLAMKTKATALTVPMTVLLFEVLLFQDEWKKRLKIIVPYLATIVIIPATMFMMHDRDLAAALFEGTNIKDIPRLQYLATEFRVLFTYLRLLVLPVGQNLDYDYPLAGSITDLPVMMLALVHAAVLAWSIWLVRRKSVFRVVGMGMIWFYLTLSIESTLIPLEPIFEHRLYLPSVGICMAAGTYVATLYTRLDLWKVRAALMVPCIIVPLFLGLMTVHRNTVWQSGTRLWEDTAMKSPSKARPFYTLGQYYQRSGRAREAIDAYRRAIRNDPESYEAHVNYGIALWEAGFREEAVREIERSLSITPSAGGYYNLAVSYYRMQMYALAIESFRLAIDYHRNFPEAYVGLAESHLALDEPARAGQTVTDGLAVSPDHKPLYFVLAKAQLAMGQADEAFRTYERLASIDPAEAKELLDIIRRGR